MFIVADVVQVFIIFLSKNCQILKQVPTRSQICNSHYLIYSPFYLCLQHMSAISNRLQHMDVECTMEANDSSSNKTSNTAESEKCNNPNTNSNLDKVDVEPGPVKLQRDSDSLHDSNNMALDDMALDTRELSNTSVVSNSTSSALGKRNMNQSIDNNDMTLDTRELSNTTIVSASANRNHNIRSNDKIASAKSPDNVTR